MFHVTQVQEPRISANARKSLPEAFLEWARSACVPLHSDSTLTQRSDVESLGRMIGDATVVALTEGVHGAAEPLEVRNELIQYLVRKKGFTAVAIESGIVESRRVYEFVRGERGSLSTALAEGISWTFDRLPQNRSLVRWLRDYNVDPRHSRKVNFYGFDVAGSPGEPGATRGVDTALFEALKFIERVDATEAGALHARLDGILTSLRFDFDRSGSASNYDGLNERQRDALTVAIADLVNLMEVREGRYTAASSNTEYEWAHRAAIGARQVDGWLRHVPPGGFNATDPLRAQSERTQFQSSAGAVRDRAQADNLEWILKQEGPQGKVLVFAHRYHLSGTPVRANWLGTYQQDVMGTYLRRRFGERLLTICNLIGEGEVECGGRQCCDGVKQSLGRRPPESIEALADQVGAARFLLDLRTAPRPVAKWLDEVRPLGRGTLGQGHDELHVSVARAFDVLLYLDVVTSACSCRSHVDSTD